MREVVDGKKKRREREAIPVHTDSNTGKLSQD
jgi:hypothetical protein